MCVFTLVFTSHHVITIFQISIFIYVIFKGCIFKNLFLIGETLQCFVGFCHIATQISHNYICTTSLLSLSKCFIFKDFILLNSYLKTYITISSLLDIYSVFNFKV